MSREIFTNRTSAKEAFSDRLRRWLESKGWSQSDLSRHLGVKPAVVQRWVAGIHLPSAATLRVLNLLLTGSDKKVEIVADPFEDWPEPKDPRGRLVKEIKKFALEADPQTDAKLINALLENVQAFREVLERRQRLKEK